MKLIIVAALSLIATCAAGPAPPNYFSQYPQYRNPQYYQDLRARAGIDRSAAVLRSVNEVNERGYNYAYDTQNGISAEETGVEANGIQAQGGYSYTGDDGQVYSVRYTAGDNGFQAVGAHIPTPPPIPEAIARALAQNARDEAAGIYDDGSYNENKYSPGVVAARAQYQASRYFPRFRNGQYY